MPTDQKYIGTNFELEKEAIYEDCEFQAVDFSTLCLNSYSFIDCTFNQCNLANVELLSASVRNCIFFDSNLIGINWCLLKNVSGIQFESCKLNYSIFHNLKLRNSRFINSSLVEVDFSGCDLSQSDFSLSNFAGANLNGCNLTEADFRTSKEYIFDIRTAKLKDAKFSFPYVASLITALGAKVEL